MATLHDVMFDVLSRFASEITVVEVTLTLDTVAYASGDVLADTQEVEDAVRTEGGYGKVVAAVVLDKDDQAQGLDLVFMRSNESIGTENAALDMTDAEAEVLTGFIEVASGDYIDLTNSQIALVGGLNVPIYASAGTSVYMAAISRGTGTYTANGIVVKLFIEQY